MDEYLFNALNTISATCDYHTNKEHSCENCPMCGGMFDDIWWICKVNEIKPHEWQFEETKIYKMV